MQWQASDIAKWLWRLIDICKLQQTCGTVVEYLIHRFCIGIHFYHWLGLGFFCFFLFFSVLLMTSNHWTTILSNSLSYLPILSLEKLLCNGFSNKIKLRWEVVILVNFLFTYHFCKYWPIYLGVSKKLNNRLTSINQLIKTE